MSTEDDWAPDACTLPTPERPLRVAEFDDLFAHVVRLQRPEPTRLDLVIVRDAEAGARDLAARESECCSFFSFEFESAGDDVVMHVDVPPQQVEVLDAIEARVAS
ncbi:MAG: hypothetical protein QOD36_3592 [Mycobacterium sp.]|jgi:hypothetical protein|nr:hypothetical protein [Mycobacterium sp.]MDT5329544.1 hypothetical protein [Mycobacterium sp.]